MKLKPLFFLLHPKSLTLRQVLSASWRDREQIKHEDVNLFCWRREANLKIVDYLMQCLDSFDDPISFSTSLSDLDQKLSMARKKWDPDHTEIADAFWIDVFEITRDFLDLSKSYRGTIHLNKVENNACNKFHVDGYSFRLFTTYHGKGTEWLPEDATNRKALGKTNKQIVKDPLKIQQMKPFEVGILKGELPNRLNPTPGIVHRSPEIEHIGEKRVILRIDI